MKDNKQKSGLGITIPLMTCVPLIVFGILVIWFCGARFTAALYDKVEAELREISSSVLMTYDLMYPGDFELYKRGNVVAYFKGDSEVTGNNEIIDGYKDVAGTEISIFYRDTRMLTTLTDENGERLVGTGVNTVIQNEVVEGKTAKFYKRVRINNKDYCAFYRPILTPAGGCIGMVAVAKESREINTTVRNAIVPMISIVGVALILAAILSWNYSRGIAGAIKSVQYSLSTIAEGNLSREVDYKLLKRNDEFADIGKSIQKMQKALHVLVEKDTLTNLFNRRLANRRLTAVMKAQRDMGTKFCVALGDIDFFKKVNDNYGHEMGDVVLREIAAILRSSMMGKGFASRWGGEEFLLVFEDCDIVRATKIMNDILDKVRALEIESMQNEVANKEVLKEIIDSTDETIEIDVAGEGTMEDRYAAVQRDKAAKIIKVTMTFGLVRGLEERDSDTLVRMADEKLYFGKEHGRNQLVVEECEEENGDSETV